MWGVPPGSGLLGFASKSRQLVVTTPPQLDLEHCFYISFFLALIPAGRSAEPLPPGERDSQPVVVDTGGATCLVLAPQAGTVRDAAPHGCGRGSDPDQHARVRTEERPFAALPDRGAALARQDLALN